MQDIHAVSTPLAPAAGGHYSQGMTHGNMLFVSGQLPIRPDGLRLTAAPFEEQCRQAIANVLGVVTGAGLTRERVVKVTAYIVGVDHWPIFNRIYAEVFESHRPARSVVPVPELHHGLLLEIEAIAAGPLS
jgi:reactive intermediate/imine deaminase